MLKPGDIIRKARTEKNMSIRSLSSLSGVSHTEISRIEKGKRINPSPNNLLKISDALNIDYNYLLELSGYIPNKNEINLDDSFCSVSESSCEYDTSIYLKRKVLELISSDIRKNTGLIIDFNEDYMINNKVGFDFVGFSDTAEVFCCVISSLGSTDLLNTNSIKATFADFYFNFKHTFDEGNIHFISAFVVDDMVCYDELNRILKCVFNHFRPSFDFKIFLSSDLR